MSQWCRRSSNIYIYFIYLSRELISFHERCASFIVIFHRCIVKRLVYNSEYTNVHKCTSAVNSHGVISLNFLLSLSGTLSTAKRGFDGMKL